MKIHFLQAVRALAASLVVADHALLQISDTSPENRISHLAWALGDAGVYVFFVISGFIMVHISWENFGRRTAPADFLWRRLVRIVPLYWLATLAAMAYHRVSVTHGAHAGWSDLICSLTFIPYSGDDGGWHPILPQGWTLNYEMMFYAVFTLGLALPRKIALPAVGGALAVLLIIGPLLAIETVSLSRLPDRPLVLVGHGIGYAVALAGVCGAGLACEINQISRAVGRRLIFDLSGPWPDPDDSFACLDHGGGTTVDLDRSRQPCSCDDNGMGDLHVCREARLADRDEFLDRETRRRPGSKSPSHK